MQDTDCEQCFSHEARISDLEEEIDVLQEQLQEFRDAVATLNETIF